MASTYVPGTSGRERQTEALSQSARQVNAQLDDARALRRTKSTFFTSSEKRRFDEIFSYTEDALNHAVAMVERESAASDRNQLPSMLRDTSSIQAELRRLEIASEGLQPTLAQLHSRKRPPIAYPTPRSSPPLQQSGLKPPQIYEESAFLSEGRRRNTERRASALTLLDSSPPDRASRPYSTQSLPTQLSQLSPQSSISELPGDDYCKPMVSSARFSPDMSIPEVLMPPDQHYLHVEMEQKFGAPSQLANIDSRSGKGSQYSTPLGRRVQGNRRTGRARSQSWLENRALQ